jgi:hypothetical protein
MHAFLQTSRIRILPSVTLAVLVMLVMLVTVLPSTAATSEVEGASHVVMISHSDTATALITAAARTIR